VKRTVCLSVDTSSDAEFVEAFERLSRICAGEILSGREARVYEFNDEGDEDDD